MKAFLAQKNYFAEADGRPLVVVRKAGRLSDDKLEDIIKKRIHDTHGLVRNTIGCRRLYFFLLASRLSFWPEHWVSCLSRFSEKLFRIVGDPMRSALNMPR